MTSVRPARERWDVIVLGARCAGATLAAFLGRAGARVLCVDRSPLPSDVVLSTHTVHPAGVAVLEELGLLPALLEVTPPIRHVRIGRGSGTIDLSLAEDQLELCPRRARFDGLLQDEARAAGVELCERTTAKELLQQGGRVVGLRLEGPGGTRQVFADWVVGADGRDSWLAQQVGAAEYLAYDAARAMYWSYWEAPRDYGRCSDYPCGMYVVNRQGTVRVAFHTDHGQVLVGSLPERTRLAPWRSDPLGALQADLAEDPMLASFTRAPPLTKVRGFLPQRYFLRPPVGPGWLLLGDAGVHKEFVTGDGMSEALLQARAAAAGLAGGEAGVQRWGLQRDVDALPFFFFGKLQGAAGKPPALDELVLSQAMKSGLQQRFIETLAHRISPLNAIGGGQVLRWLLPQVLRGQLGLLRDLWQRGSALAPMQRALAEAVARSQKAPSAPTALPAWSERGAQRNLATG
jgi:flavin-dependent dehydrogenase